MEKVHSEVVRSTLETIRGDQNRGAMRTLVTDASPEALAFEPAVGEWSIAQILRHLGDIEQVRQARIDRMLAEDGAEVPNSDMPLPPGERDGNDAAVLLRRYEQLVEQTVARMAAMSEADAHRRGVQPPDLRVGRTATAGTSILEQVSRIPRHLEDHLNQARNNLSAYRAGASV